MARPIRQSVQVAANSIASAAKQIAIAAQQVATTAVKAGQLLDELRDGTNFFLTIDGRPSKIGLRIEPEEKDDDT